MLIHTDHLIPGMMLDRDIELRAGSFLITRRELDDGRLTKKIIGSIHKFSGQIVPENHRVFIQDDKLALEYIKNVVNEDLYRVAKAVSSGKDYPNFLNDVDLHEKVMRVMEVLFTYPNIIRTMYDVKYNSDSPTKALNLILDHSIRTSLLAVALGLKIRSTLISMVCLGMAALLHDIGIFSTSAYPGLSSLDDLSDKDLENFIEEHQVRSQALIEQRELTINPFQRKEILHIVASHHRPDQGERIHKNTLIFHFADLVDEMVSQLPHRVRYNFTRAQIETLGKRCCRRTGLVRVLLDLTKLYKKQGGLVWEIVSKVSDLFGMKELLSGDFDIKLQEIIDSCHLNSAQVNPPLEGNLSPRTIYCSKSNEEGLSCEHLLHTKAGIRDSQGNIREYFKCNMLGPRFQNLIEGGKS